jgi:hypothetical protein
MLGWGTACALVGTRKPTVFLLTTVPAWRLSTRRGERCPRVLARARHVGAFRT